MSEQLGIPGYCGRCGAKTNRLPCPHCEPLNRQEPPSERKHRQRKAIQAMYHDAALVEAVTSTYQGAFIVCCVQSRPTPPMPEASEPMSQQP